jgi:hypothetical protein
MLSFSPNGLKTEKNKSDYPFLGLYLGLSHCKFLISFIGSKLLSKAGFVALRIDFGVETASVKTTASAVANSFMIPTISFGDLILKLNLWKNMVFKGK